MNKEQVNGTIDEVVGTIKRKAGEWTGNAPLEIKGIVQEFQGEIEVAAGDAKAALGDAAVEAALQLKTALDPTKAATTPPSRG